MQTKTQSLVEAFLNTLSGYVISVIVQVTLFPFFGIHLPLHTNMVIVAIFTAISIVRSYLWRRYFNRRHLGASYGHERDMGR